MATNRVDALLTKGSLVDRSSAPKRLFCFPWGGGGASYYIRLSPKFPEDIEGKTGLKPGQVLQAYNSEVWARNIVRARANVYSVLAVVLPARDGRLNDEPYHSMEELAEDICQAILKQYTDKPFAFYGHSFGAKACMEVAWRLRKHGHQPTHMFISGSFAPQSNGEAAIPNPFPDGLTDEALLNHIRKKGGTPPAILNNKSMQELFLPPLRMDLGILRTYSKSIEGVPPVSFDIIAMDGVGDIDHLFDEWRVLTTGKFSTKMFPGGHFFLTEPDKAILLVEHISSVLNSET